MITIYGKGSHGKVIADALNGRECRFTDDADGTRPDGDFIVGVGDNRVRERLGGTVTVMHQTAIVSPLAAIGQGVFVAARAFVGPGANVAAGVIVNTGAIVEHDCRIGPFAHVASGVVLGGGVEIGRGALVGAGAVVKPWTKIGDWAVVGCGAVVVSDVPAGETWVGVPARPVIGKL